MSESVTAMSRQALCAEIKRLRSSEECLKLAVAALVKNEAKLNAEVGRLTAALLDKIYNSHPDEAATVARAALERKP